MTKTKDEPNNEVTNFYEVMPKKYLKKKNNPYYEHHKLNLPMRCIILGGTGSMKTNTALHILEKVKNTWGNVKIYTRDADEPLYNYLKDSIPTSHLQIYESLDSLKVGKSSDQSKVKKDKDEFERDIANLVIFDDMVMEKEKNNLNKMNEIFLRGRKIGDQGCSVLYLSQSFFDIPFFIRKQTEYLILKKLNSQSDLFRILREVNLGCSKTALLNMYLKCTTNKKDFMLIDMGCEPEYRFRYNLLEILNPKDFENNNVENSESKQEEILGGGLLDGMISKNFNNKSRYILKLYGNLPIVKIDVIKNVVNPLITSTLNLLAQKNYDKLYHLGLIVYFSNGKSVILQKEATIKIDDVYSLKNRELRNIEIPNNLTLNTLLKTVYDKVGNKLFLYSGYNNNCQNFVINILESNNLLNDEDLRNYIKQDTDDIFQNDKVRKIVNSVTDLGAVIDNGFDVVDNIKNNISDKINNFTGMSNSNSNNMTTGSGIIIHKVVY